MKNEKQSLCDLAEALIGEANRKEINLDELLEAKNKLEMESHKLLCRAVDKYYEQLKQRIA